MDKSEQLEVSQADRDEAANIWRDYVARVGECIAEKAIREGASDCTMIVQAFARHRQATEARMAAAVEALEWYQEQAQAACRAMESKNTTAMTAILTALSLDNGNRAIRSVNDGQG